MGRIDTGNFGFAQQRVGRTPAANDVSGGMFQAGQRLAGTVQGMVENQLDIRDREARQREQEARFLADQAAKAKSLVAHAAMQGGLNDAFDQVAADVSSGKIDKVAGLAAWKDAREQVIADNIEAVPQDRRELVTAGVKGHEGALTNRLFDVFRKRDQNDVAGGLVTYREQQERLASSDPKTAIAQYHRYVDELGPSAGWTPEQSAVAKQGFVEKVQFNLFRSTAQAQLQAGSVAGLDEVQKRLAGPEGDLLDPKQRNQLDQTIFGWRQSLEARAERDADKAAREEKKRFDKASDILKSGRDLALTGAFLAPEFISELVTTAQGTGLESQVQQLLASQKQVAGFASLPPDKRAAALESLRARRADPGIGTDPEGQQLLSRAEQIDESLRRKVEAGEAWTAAQSVGIVRNVPALNLSNPSAAVEAIGVRMREIGSVEAWAGRKVSPFQPEEAEQLAKFLRTMQPEQASSMLSQLGTVLNDSDRIAALAKQVGDKDGTLGMVMAFAGAKTTEGRYTSQLILEGERRIKDKTVRVDGALETGWRGTIATEIRGAYSNQEVETKIIDAAFKIAAATDGDVDRAIRLASGGIVERNGGKIPLPYGMPEREFDKRIESISVDAIGAQAPAGYVLAGPARVPVAEFVRSIPKARLVHAGQGLYNVRAGNTLVTNERGQRITIRVAP